MRESEVAQLCLTLSDPMAHVFPHKKQYPLKPEVKEGLKPIMENLKEQPKWNKAQYILNNFLIL